MKGLNAEKIACADVILAPIDIIESKGYIENLLKIAKESVRHDKYKLKLPTHSGQKELNGARGLWIPSSSGKLCKISFSSSFGNISHLNLMYV